jgi:hypothetical protein
VSRHVESRFREVQPASSSGEGTDGLDGLDGLELPPYRAVLVVDTSGYGSNSDVGQAALAGAVFEILAAAFDRAGLGCVWRNALFPHNTGDGVGLGFDTRYLAAVLTRFFDALQSVLADHDSRRPPGHHVRLRMRASLHVGPVREVDPRRCSTAAIGSAVVTAHRLLDTPAVRDVLERSDPGRTFLAVVLSHRVFDDVVATGYARLPASSFVPASVRIKEYAGPVHLYVPHPSGDLLHHGFGVDEQGEPAGATPLSSRPAGDRTNIMNGVHHGTAIQIGTVYGQDLR